MRARSSGTLTYPLPISETWNPVLPRVLYSLILDFDGCDFSVGVRRVVETVLAPKKPFEVFLKKPLRFILPPVMTSSPGGVFPVQ